MLIIHKGIFLFVLEIIAVFYPSSSVAVWLLHNLEFIRKSTKLSFIVICAIPYSAPNWWETPRMEICFFPTISADWKSLNINSFD